MDLHTMNDQLQGLKGVICIHLLNNERWFQRTVIDAKEVVYSIQEAILGMTMSNIAKKAPLKHTRQNYHYS